MLISDMNEQRCQVDYQYLYDSASCGLLVFKLNGKILHANETFLNWIEVSQDDILSKNFSDLLDKGGKFYYQLFVHPLLKMHKEAKEIDFTIKTATGNFPCLLSATVLTNNEGEDDIIHATIFKIAERKKYESELLKKKVEVEADRQLKIMALNEVAFDQAHLVRAPLANMLGIISLIEQMPVNDEVREMLSMLSESTMQLDVQVKQIVKKTNL